MHRISFDLLSHVRDNWGEDIPEEYALAVAEEAARTFDSTATWDLIDQNVSAAWRKISKPPV